MKVIVVHGIDDLANDLAAIARRAPRDMSRVVREGVRVGNSLARDFARAASGPHGKNYYKRITGEMTGPLQGEYGPTGVVAGNAVGAGWRNRPPNTDLDKSLDIIGPAFRGEVRRLPDQWFWP